MLRCTLQLHGNSIRPWPEDNLDPPSLCLVLYFGGVVCTTYLRFYGYKPMFSISKESILLSSLILGNYPFTLFLSFMAVYCDFYNINLLIILLSIWTFSVPHDGRPSRPFCPTLRRAHLVPQAGLKTPASRAAVFTDTSHSIWFIPFPPNRDWAQGLCNQLHSHPFYLFWDRVSLNCSTVQAGLKHVISRLSISARVLGLQVCFATPSSDCSF